MSNELGSRIKAIRKNKHLTLKEFGELFHPVASDSIVSRWERNVSVPSKQRLKKIAELGGVTVSTLLKSDESLLEENKRLREALKSIEEICGKSDQIRANDDLLAIENVAYEALEGDKQ